MGHSYINIGDENVTVQELGIFKMGARVSIVYMGTS